tara:strand:- start:32580 stop:33530 length:951 start_codon:yes stop_codon:yes gene_type:complete
MNNKTRRIPFPIALSTAIAIATLAGTLTAANQGVSREASAARSTAPEPEPMTEAAVTQAIEEYVRARYAGDVETATSRLHENIARRMVADNYWGQPSKEWVRPFTRDLIAFYADPESAQRLDNPSEGRCDIEVFDIEQQSASARVIMEDAVDYLHMIHLNGRWVVGDSAVILLKESGAKPPALSDRHAQKIEQVSRDYCVGFYEIDGDKVQSTCHPSLSKRSVEQARLSDGTEFEHLSGITWEEINILGETFNTQWGFDADDRCEVEIYEIRGNIAAVKMTGTVWFDYFHMMKVNGEWSIVNIMYESLDRSRWVDV